MISFLSIFLFFIFSFLSGFHFYWAMGGGDEVWGLNQLLNNHSLAWTIGLITVITLTIHLLWKAYQLIENKRKIFWFLGFFLLPTLIDILLVLGVLNTILEKGILNKYWILGFDFDDYLDKFCFRTLFINKRKYL
jgi:hypothetical protein